MDKKEKKSRKARKDDLDDFDMEKELADLEEPLEPLMKKDNKKTVESGDQAKPTGGDDENPETDAAVESKQKGKKGRKGKKQLEDDFDMEKELAEVEQVAKVQALPKAKKTVGKETSSVEEEKPLPAAPSADKKKKPTKEAAIAKEDEESESPTAKAPEKVSEDKLKDGEKKKPVNKAKEQMKEQLRRIQEEKERLERLEDERIRKEEEEDQKRLDDIRKEKERKEKEKQKKKDRKERLKSEGKLLTPKQKQDQARAQAMIESLKAQGITIGAADKAARKAPPPKKTQTQSSEELIVVEKQPEVELEESESEESLDDWDKMADKDEDVQEPELLVQPPEAAVSSSDDLSPMMELTTANTVSTQKLGYLRSAVVCVLGHVDTGKTKILDKIRKTNVQDMEAGGITQQIGATMVPGYVIQTQCAMVRGFSEQELRLPGLLIIDTPGHASFSNLRSRGSSLCDIAILVVDIMHGLEPQTIESINMLKSRKTPFIVALNKIDRLFGWKTMPKLDVRDAITQQTQNVQMEFKQRCQETVVQFAEQGLNAAVFYENPDSKTFISMVPTSAHTGDGMGNLMALIVEMCQNMLSKRLTFSNDLQCTVLEVKELTGLGTTVDVILTNGSLSEGDTIVLAGFEGPIVTQVRGLLMPQPLRELRVKNPYEKHKIIHGAQGVKILAKDLETSLAGTPLYVANTPEEQEHFKKEAEKHSLKSIQRSDKGVYVQASTLGSLEALLEFLGTSKIPYCGINIGPVHKKDVRTASAMLEQEPEYAVILAFDVKIEREAQLLADELGVRIFAAEIIYHLFDRFTQYKEDLKAKKREENKHLAIFPCKLKILPQFVFNTRDPIIVGVVVDAGVLKIGTPLCVPSKEFVDIGIVTSIEVNHKAMDLAKKGQEVCIKIDPEPGSTPKLLGRHFEIDDVMVSKISRPSIDVCKEYFRDDLQKADWQLMVDLKKLLNIF